MNTSRAVAVDVLCVLLFATVGRSTHSESTDLTGVLSTAWPFLFGCAAGPVAARLWRGPVELGVGAIVWLCTVAGGVLLRLASGDTAQPAFVVVATVSLGVLMLGWRAGYVLIQQSRQRTADKRSAATRSSTPTAMDSTTPRVTTPS
jgi:ribose/xylose/arabinose/galactoside ABC-type transport system permease subunit